MKAYDVYSCLRGPLSPPEDIIIVGIDNESFSIINLPWPWPRSMHGKLIQALNNSGARAIIMDIIFSDPSFPDEDNALAEAIRQYGHVVLAADVEIVKAEKFSQRILITPLEEFLNAGARFGISSIPVDSDNVVRRIFWGTPEAPSLEVSALDMLGISHENDYRKMIHFTGPAYHIPYVSYYKALSHDTYLPEGFFRNKIVIVGKYSPPSEESTEDLSRKYRLHLQPPSPVRGVDMFATPFYIMENKLTPGMEIHAHMLFSLVKNDFLEPLRASEAMALLILLSFSLTIINRNWSPLKSISLTIICLIIYIFLSYLVFSKNGLFLPFAAPFFAIFVNFISSGVLSFVGVERRRRYLRKAFSLYLSPQVAQKVLEDPEKLKLGGQRVLATVLFSDLAGFTEMSEKIEPEEVVSILTRHTTEMTKIIFQYRGMLDKFIGDAIMAVWGTPVEDEDQAYHACMSALEMQRKMKNIADKISVPEYTLSMRIGINTGTVMAGNMGSDERFDFTVIGDNVNIASRLEALNKVYGTEILISESTREKMGGRLEVRELDLVRVKGKKQCIKIYELIDGERKSFIDSFEEGLRLYQRGYFDTARKKFSEALGQNPKDRPSKLFIERCDYLIHSLLEREWDGVWHFEIKS
jgi:adenylate cyclase